MTAENIEKRLIASGAFRETKPTLGTSGIPLFYFVNTEKLLNDNGKWETYADDASGMIGHAVTLYKYTNFAETIRALADLALNILNGHRPDAVSGFQRRDWPFSGPLAAHLNLPHLAIYKNGQTEEMRFDSSGITHVNAAPDYRNKTVLHVSDLLTAGSSAVNGWLPVLETLGAKCLALVNVVSRKQTGESTLQQAGVPCYSLVMIDETFLQKYATNPAICINYFQDPENTVREYLLSNGADAFIPFFKPQNAKLPRAITFYNNYAVKYLTGQQLADFNAKVSQEFGTSAAAIVDAGTG